MIKKTLKLAFVLAVLIMCFQPARADWVRQDTKSFAWFKDVFFLNENKGWIIGTDGVMLSTDDGGQSWQQTRKFTTDSFVQIHFVNEYTGWLLCERSLYDRGANSTSYLRRTTDGGRTWERIEFQDGGRERVTRLLFSPGGGAIAFGEGGVFYKQMEDGTIWKKSQTAIHYLLLDGGYLDDRIGALVGTGGTIMFTEDSGLTWEKATLLGDTDTRFNAVFFSGQKSAWAVGTQGRIFRSAAGGRQWRQQQSTVTANLNDVYFTSSTDGWAVGDHGIIVRTRDGGTNWFDVPTRVKHRLEKVIFTGRRGWAVGFGGTVLTYDESTPRDAGSKPNLQRRN